MRKIYITVCLLFSIFISANTFAKKQQHVVQVAASVSIKQPLSSICQSFEEKTSYQCHLLFAPIGHLYAHIMYGAQYDILLTSDESYVQSLMNANKIDGEDRFILAIGRVVLWSSDENIASTDIQNILQEGNMPLAMANPGVTPYGAAAKEILQVYNLWHRLHDNITFGKNLAQTYEMIANKQVKMGFVSVAQLSQDDRDNKRYWEPEPNSYHPVVHEVVSLKSESIPESKKAFLAFLQSSEACKILGDAGYQCWSELGFWG